jgi:hypothetical protein
MLDKIDKIVSDGLSMLERGAKVSRHHCGFDDVWYVDPALAQDITARVELMAKHLMTPEEMLDAAKKSKFRSFVEPILNGIAKNGTHPKAKPNYVISTDLISKEHATLFPYMVKSFLKDDVHLSGFEKANGKKMWFATTSQDDQYINAVGYEGSRKTLPLSKLSQLGFSKINGKEDQLIGVCREEIGSIDNSELKKVAFFVGKNAIPGFRLSNAKEKLNQFLSGIPDIKRNISPGKKEIPATPKMK